MPRTEKEIANAIDCLKSALRGGVMEGRSAEELANLDQTIEMMEWVGGADNSFGEMITSMTNAEALVNRHTMN